MRMAVTYGPMHIVVDWLVWSVATEIAPFATVAAPASGELQLAARLTGESRRPAPERQDVAWICTSCQTWQADWAPVCAHCQRPGTLIWQVKISGTALV
jgi:hypothetical protein